jgi:alanyl-tRNA synthetase
VRRIEALTGGGAVKYVRERLNLLDEASQEVGGKLQDVVNNIAMQMQHAKKLAREFEQYKMKAALGGGGRSAAGSEDDTRDVKGVKVIARRVSGLEKGALRALSDSLRDRLGSGIVVIASENDGKVALVVSVTKDLTSRVQAGRIVKEIAPIVGGGGGGRPDFAEAGGKDPSKIDELITRAPGVIETLL